MSDEEGSLEEKRVFADAGEPTALFVATGGGVARVSVSGDIVGEFALEHRGAASDVAAVGGRVAVATPEDVLVVVDGEFTATGFGPADAVEFDGGLLAAGDGRIARRGRDDRTWTTVGELEGVRSIDGDLVAAAAGVHRLDGTHVGLEAATDVATAGRPLAATESGLYYLANGWVDALEGSFRAVAGRRDGLAHAATGDALYERPAADEQWTPVELPVDEPVADVAYGPLADGGVGAIYAVTGAGTVLVDAGDGWRSRSLGLPNVAGVAVVAGRDA